MALLSDLVRAVASVEGLDESLVVQFARAAREAGLISQSGRGRSAARMGEADAAVLLTAANTALLAKDVPATVKHYRALELQKKLSTYPEMDPIFMGGSGVEFGTALENLLNLCAPSNISRLLSLMKGMVEEPVQCDAEDYPDPGPAWLEVEFRKPYGIAVIRIMAPFAYKGSTRWVVSYSERHAMWFGRSATQIGFRSSGPDRLDRTVITHRTLMAVAEVLAT